MELRPPASLLQLFTYRQLYSFGLALCCFILCLLTALLSFLGNILLKKMLSRNQCSSATPASKSEASNEATTPDIVKKTKLPYQGLNDPEDPLNTSKIYTYLKSLNSGLSWLSYIYLGGVLVSLSAFDFLPIWVSIFAVLIILLLRLTKSFRKRSAGHLSIEKKAFRYFKEPWTIMVLYRPKLVIISMLAVISMSLLMPLTTYKSCINDHVKGYGIPLLGKFIYSSAFTRFLTLPNVCSDEGPCHIYTTLPFNTSSSVFINVHTPSNVDSISINYDTMENFEDKGIFSYTQSSSLTVTPNYDHTGDRNIHSVLLTDLKPDQVYTLEIFYNGKSQAIRRYHTLPDEHSQKSYNLLYGGDIGYTETAQQMAQVVASKDPRALVIGGDIAYDDGDISCSYTMDLFLWMMEKEVFDQVGKLVPMILTLGNHDIGYTSLNGAKMPINDDGPSFYLNFPQTLPIDENGVQQNLVPTVKERSAIHSHMIGNILNVFLDSGYMTSYKGDQLEWLVSESEKYKHSPKIAMYHDPIFSPCFKHADDYNTTAIGMDDWISAFTKYKYMAVFENHAHIYKKTFPLVGFEKASDGIGTLYLGDGAWGPSGHCQNGKELVSNQRIYDSYAAINNVWVVQVNPKNSTISYKPIGLDNRVIDKVAIQNMSLHVDL